MHTDTIDIPRSSTLDEPQPQTEAEIAAANGPEVDLPGDEPTIVVGDINARLGFIVSSRLLSRLGVKRRVRIGAGYHILASDWPQICQALISHIEGLKK